MKPAPFETFAEAGEREKSEHPYNEAFIKRCREKALEYDKTLFHGKPDRILRSAHLQALEEYLPVHFRAEVFAGISDFGSTIGVKRRWY
jgi:hypothetical protein